MADPRAFISFDFDHNISEKNLFIGQSKNSKIPFRVEDWSSKTSLPQSNWEEMIREKINKCHMVIVLVGKYMASATGVAKEIKMANELNVPILGVYVGGANSSSNLPAGLSRSRTTRWDWNAITSEIDKVMKEGKNAKEINWGFIGGVVVGIAVIIGIILGNKKA
jgi:Thoeris protein ThsB, TIR-like domain